jgi:hypothetical protein
MRRVRFLVLLPVVFAFLGGVASAECPLDGGLELLERGTRTMAGGDFAKACLLLQRSYECDETKAMRLFLVAQCADLAGNISTAVSRYDEYLLRVAQMDPSQQVGHKASAGIALERSRAIRPEVPRLTLTVPPLAPRLTRVRLDGREVIELGTGMPVDPGQHTVETEVPGGAVTSLPFVISRGEKKFLELDVKLPPHAEPARPPAGPGTRRIATYVFAGASLAAVAVGIVSGLIAADKAAKIKDGCNPATKTCNAASLALVPEAQAVARVATIGFVAGLTGTTAVTVFLLTEPPPTQETGHPPNQATGALLTLHGVW